MIRIDAVVRKCIHEIKEAEVKSRFDEIWRQCGWRRYLINPSEVRLYYIWFREGVKLGTRKGIEYVETITCPHCHAVFSQRLCDSVADEQIQKGESREGSTGELQDLPHAGKGAK